MMNMFKITKVALGSAAICAMVAFTMSSTSSAFAESKQTTPAKSKAKPKKPTVKVVNNAHCPVMGSEIGSMGEGTSVTYKGYKVSLCCSGCVSKFNANPDAYLQTALADSKRK